MRASSRAGRHLRHRPFVAPMRSVAGADGCPGGWICIRREKSTGELITRVYTTAEELIHQVPKPGVLAIDIPIGLCDSGPRVCDQLSRRILGRRACCVFSAPIRPALQARDREDASRITRTTDGRGVGCQAWNIYPKIRQVDAVLTVDLGLQKRVFEIHPEVSFAAWQAGPIAARKKSPAGLAARVKLIDRYFGSGSFDAVRSRHRRRDVQSDDIADAFAALWSAERISLGTAVVLPDPPPVDSNGLLMRIVY